MSTKKRMTKEQKDFAAYKKQMMSPVRVFEFVKEQHRMEALFKLIRDFLETKYPGEFKQYVESLEKKHNEAED